MPVSSQTLSAEAQEIVYELIACARYGEFEEIKETISSNSTTYLITKDSSGNTALHMASANGHIDIVDFIIEMTKSTDISAVNIQNDSGNTPLHWSALNGHQKVVETLVKHGADIKIKNRSGRTAMFEAQQNNHEKVVEFLLNIMDPVEPQPSEEKIEEEKST
ncbi:hypothetical protein G9A89_016311 [Geosiphon pyriformis]|nr:hypothetical protein G9A89_016311 [Geosiphon pyriformis]